MKKLLASLAIVAALGAGAFAISSVLPAGAQSSPPSTSSDAPTSHPGGRAAKVKNALDGLVQNGTITQDQENAVIQALKDSLTSDGHGRLGPRARVARGMLKVAADKIGVQPKDLIAARRNGQSIADVANSKGVQPSDVVTAIVDAGNQRIDQALSNGHLQQDRADALKAKLPQLADRVVNTKGLPERDARPDAGQGSDQSSSSSS
jgi:hypothetical protein